MRSRIFTLALLALSLCACTTHPPQLGQTDHRPPNIIVILTDDLGWADVGFNGATDILTPNLDRIAQQGVIFENGYVSHPYCSPSRAGLLTGRYQARFGHDCNLPYQGENGASIGTPPAERMISEVLKEQGYRTGAIGKWHVGDHPDVQPLAQGFDEWFGFAGGGMNYWGHPTTPIKTIYRNHTQVPEEELSYLTDDFSDEAVRFISQPNDAPFFLYLAYNAPHAPDHATQQYLDNAQHIEYGGRSVYAAMVNAVDAGVGKIDSALIAHGMKENTIVVFLSDNGGRKKHADNRPNRGHKGMLFEGGIKVPFFITWPGHIDGQRTYPHPVISLDLFPTFLQAAGTAPSQEAQLDGTSLLPYLAAGNEQKPHQIMFWRSVGGFEYAVRKENFKLYKSAYKDKTLLFDLDKDPYERTDIADQFPEVITTLNQAYTQWDAQNIEPGWVDPHPENVLLEAQDLQKTRRRALPRVQREGFSRN
ncbi:sulfatase-like hydrolase/transferase [Pontibacter sp. G13]|uniref:sulfatase-like hydrolase/transferase n=1 Tax=Pontibacter sp. G13 TaxID=3074898 RepID=UPI00288C08C6|nr:sulfatase-like hydrolase/transferase [Pontibacter sp. G13]WNJ20333.1 sulfatase-like hydrolase/transferase [Pontibacter sp. G13]